MSLTRLDQRLTEWMERYGHGLLRCCLGLVFLWFGAPKLVPGLSPAEDLVRATVCWWDAGWFMPALGLWEVAIGLCLISRRLLKLGLVLMAGHMLGTALPLITLPEVAWKCFPVATLEGQYILKNLVLVAAAIVVGGSDGAVGSAARNAGGGPPRGSDAAP